MYNKLKILKFAIGFIPLLFVMKASADETTLEIELDGFSEIELDTSANLEIKIADEFSIFIAGDEKRIENTDFKVRGDKLTIDKDRDFSFFGRGGYDGNIDITITMPDISLLEMEGSGDIVLSGVDNDALELKIDGSGDIQMDGKSNHLEMEIDGSGDIDVADYEGEDVRIVIDGSGDIDIEGICETFEIRIEGSGDVKARDLICKEVQVFIDGSGDSYVHALNSFIFDSDGSGNVDVFGNPGEVVDNSRDSNTKVRMR